MSVQARASPELLAQDLKLKGKAQRKHGSLQDRVTPAHLPKRNAAAGTLLGSCTAKAKAMRSPATARESQGLEKVFPRKRTPSWLLTTEPPPAQ